MISEKKETKLERSIAEIRILLSGLGEIGFQANMFKMFRRKKNGMGNSFTFGIRQVSIWIFVKTLGITVRGTCIF